MDEQGAWEVSKENDLLMYDIVGIIVALFLLCSMAIIVWNFQNFMEDRQIKDCQVRHQVYACKLQPVHQPAWIKPNAENT